MLTQNRHRPELKVVSLRSSSKTECSANAMPDSQKPSVPDGHTSGTSQLRPQRRIMFVIEALTVGGAEHMVVDIANELSRQGDCVHVVCLSLLGELADGLSSDIPLHLLHKKPGIDLSLPLKLRQLAQRHSIEVVNSHLWTANLWTRIALVRSGIPIVVTEHNRDVWKRLHNRLLDRLLSHTMARMIAVSEDTADFYRKEVGVPVKLITVVNNGVDTQRYSAGNGVYLRRQLAGDGDFLVGTVGRLAAAKNHPRLVKAASIMRDAGVPVRVVIAGEGPNRSITEARITELQMTDRVTLLGERDDVPDLLAAFDVFVLSSDREGHPLSALEAQSAGTPVVLTDAGGSSDAISRTEKGCGGCLVEKNASALALCLTELASQPERLAEMSEFARNHAAKYFDKSLMIERYSAIFDAVQRSGIMSIV